MHVLELASFTVSKALLSNDLSPHIDKTINTLKTTENCLSIHRGFELADKTRAYVLITWDSVENSFPAKRHNGTFQYALDKLGVEVENLQTQLFVLDEDPTSILDASLFELWYSRLKPGVAQADLLLYAQTFTAQVKNDNYAEVNSAHFPQWTHASSANRDKPDVFLVGWPGAELRETFIKSRPLAEYLDNVCEMTGLEDRLLSLAKA